MDLVGGLVLAFFFFFLSPRYTLLQKIVKMKQTKDRTKKQVQKVSV